MIPPVAAIMEKRHSTRRWLRKVALLLLAIASMPITYTAVSALLARFSGQPISLTELLWSSTYQIAMALSFATPAILIWFFDRWISRVMVPFPDHRCPRCRYRLTNLVKPRCPECGLNLPDSLMENPDLAGDAGD